MICPECKSDMTALHVVVIGIKPKVECWKCTAYDMIENNAKWMGSL